MLQNMVHPQDQQLSIDEITSPLAAQMFDFCESDLFPETLQNSSEQVASSSNCCYEEQQQSYHDDMNKYNTTSSIDHNNEIQPPTGSPSTPPPPIATTGNSHLPIIFDEDQIENDISASIDFTTSPSFQTHHHQYLNNNNNQEPFDISSLNDHLSIGDMINGSIQYAAPERWPVVAPPPTSVPMLAPLPTSFEEECLPSSHVPSYMRTLRSSQPACSIIDPMMAPYLPPPFSSENSGLFAGGGGLMLGNDISHQDLDFQGDSGALFLPDNITRAFNCSSELQALSSESQHLVVHGGGGASSSTPLASEISSLEDPTFKVGKLSVEERKRKIHRYMKKRNERNFSKKIKYACRKTLADSRPRVRGRFAKNDELGELARNSNHEDEGDEDVSLFSNNSIPDHHQRKVGVKEEDDMESADIFAHISGVNSFKCNYPIQSWI